MLKIGDKVVHYEYGFGEVISTREIDGALLVSFETEHTIVIHDVIDTDYYFEDNTRVETTNAIYVYESELKKLATDFYTYSNHCHSCKKAISSETHVRCKECNWFKCTCGSCKCNYTKKIVHQ